MRKVTLSELLADLQSSPDVTNDNICNITAIQSFTLRPRVTVELRDARTLLCRREATFRLR